MKKLFEKLKLAINKVSLSLLKNPFFNKLNCYVKAKTSFLCLFILKISNAFFVFSKSKLENLIKRLFRLDTFAISNRAFFIIFLIIFLLLITIIWKIIAGYLGDKNGYDSKSRGVSVVTAPVKLGDITVIQTALGTVTPRNTVTVHSQVTGVLSQIYFKEGDLVKAGQLLAQIDPRPFEATLKQAQGNFNRDKALLSNSELDLKRYEILLKQDSISNQVYETQKALTQQYKGNVLTDEGQVSAAKLQLEFSRIASPINGRIGLRLVDPGNLIQPGDANGLFIITQIQPTTVLFSIPQDVLPSFNKYLKEPSIAEDAQANSTDKKDAAGVENSNTNSVNFKMPVEAWSSDNKYKLATGMLESIDNQIDITTGTVKLRGIFANDDLTLFPNQFVNVRLVLQVLPQVITIPTSAVQRGANGTFVYRLNKDDTVNVVPIKLGPVDGDNVQVIDGLSQNELVVVDGTDKLRNGAKVIVGNASIPENTNSKGRRRDSQKPKAGISP